LKIFPFFDKQTPYITNKKDNGEKISFKKKSILGIALKTNRKKNYRNTQEIKNKYKP
jgi:hypothetical protein